ncbi:tetratricopeptide repeat protein [Mucilaginibacter ginkgonis]|uniref:Uncharacterized protein n=1 Tax=Mucilaginibacter ginkgonis TaxID=2682091 RepID=A0A6I4HW65_9SPHI|nr:tetratricopeptide repeat protein [Mucilaginibacter ginkgonis]QQL51082.1 hypothetical protein GO620_006430 [Mucilaginibacter ginkgonis]
MQKRKSILLLFIGLFITQFAFGQSEALKGVVNNLAFYRQQKDLKYLSNAKRQVDSLIRTKRDSNNVEKNVFKAVVYSSILYTDSLNKLNQPANTLQQTTDLIDKLSARQKIFRYKVEMDFAKRCISNVYLRTGAKAMQAKSYEDALKAFEKASFYAPAYKPIYRYIGYTNTQLSKYDAAAQTYDKLLETDTLQAEDVLAAAQSHLALHDTTKALQIVQRGRKVLVNDRALLFAEANIYHNRGDYRSLQPLLEQLVNYNSGSAFVAFMAANCYDHLNKFDQAESMYLQSLNLNAKSYDAAFNLALLYFKLYTLNQGEAQKNIERAIQWFEKANTILPNNLQCLQMLQWAYLKDRNVDQLDKINFKLKQLTN